MTTTPTTVPVHSARSPKTERWLDDLGVTWTFEPDLPLTRIDQAASLANQVRHIPLDADTVERYAADMRQGDQFPAVIVAPHTGDLYALLGGNHRHAGAIKANRSTIAAYIAHGDARVLLRVRVEDNRNHGLPTSDAERLDHGLALMDSGYTQAEASRIIGLTQKKLSEHAQLVVVDARAADLGVDPGFPRLNRFTRQALGRLDDDTVFAAAADLVTATSMPIGATRDIVNAALAVEPAEALRLIATEAAEHEERGGHLAGNTRTTSRSQRALLDNALAIIKGLSPQGVYDSCPNDDVRAVLADRIMDAAAVLAPCHEKLTAKTKERAA